MDRIEISEPLDLPPSDVLAAGKDISKAIEEKIPPYDTLSLKVDVRDLRLPFDGELLIPIHTHIEQQAEGWGCHIEIGAATNESAFPRFDGVLSVDPEGRANSRLRLQGTYQPPLGLLGEFIDDTVLRGVAEASLKDFLHGFALDIATRARSAEEQTLQRARQLST